MVEPIVIVLDVRSLFLEGKAQTAEENEDSLQIEYYKIQQTVKNALGTRQLYEWNEPRILWCKLCEALIKTKERFKYGGEIQFVLCMSSFDLLGSFSQLIDAAISLSKWLGREYQAGDDIFYKLVSCDYKHKCYKCNENKIIGSRGAIPAVSVPVIDKTRIIPDSTETSFNGVKCDDRDEYDCPIFLTNEAVLNGPLQLIEQEYKIQNKRNIIVLSNIPPSRAYSFCSTANLGGHSPRINGRFFDFQEGLAERVKQQMRTNSPQPGPTGPASKAFDNFTYSGEKNDPKTPLLGSSQKLRRRRMCEIL